MSGNPRAPEEPRVVSHCVFFPDFGVPLLAVEQLARPASLSVSASVSASVSLTPSPSQPDSFRPSFSHQALISNTPKGRSPANLNVNNDGGGGVSYNDLTITGIDFNKLIRCSNSNYDTMVVGGRRRGAQLAPRQWHQATTGGGTRDKWSMSTVDKRTSLPSSLRANGTRRRPSQTNGTCP